MGKIIIFSAPSGSGKTTIIKSLLEKDLNLVFSVSATSRLPRGKEEHGKDYFFLTPEEFKSRIQNGDFLEYEEVYQDKFYGTLKEHVENILNHGKNVIFDVDVVGGLNIKKYYQERALAIFVQPPGIKALEERLKGRGTDSEEVIQARIDKAAYELTFAPRFDVVLINDNLREAQEKAYKIVKEFLEQ
ncbi:MAG: guanylate kinase [Candidatus Azobacteroides sp.]|nr:guanylate kinase [Candidatus Azobacteroides sp.]